MHRQMRSAVLWLVFLLVLLVQAQPPPSLASLHCYLAGLASSSKHSFLLFSRTVLLSTLLCTLPLGGAAFASARQGVSAAACRLDQDDLYTDGSWKLNQTCYAAVMNSVASGDGVDLTLSKVGYCDAEIKGRNQCFTATDERLTIQKLLSLCWVWQPLTCYLDNVGPGNASELATVVAQMGGVCSVGDSLQEQVAATLTKANVPTPHYKAYVLVNLLTLRPMTPTHVARCEALPGFATSEASDAEFTVGSKQNASDDDASSCLARRYLPTKHGQIYPYHRELYNQHWTTFLENNCSRGGVLLLGTGHHWHKDDPEGRHYTTMVEGVLEYLAKHWSGTVIFITAVRGHNHCDSAGAPSVLSPGAFAQEETSSPGDMSICYHWSLPGQFDHAWRATARRIPSISSRFFVLNTTSATLQRPDMHKPGDCLHFCEPGLPNMDMSLLLTLLQTLAKSRVR